MSHFLGSSSFVAQSNTQTKSPKEDQSGRHARTHQVRQGSSRLMMLKSMTSTLSQISFSKEVYQPARARGYDAMPISDFVEGEVPELEMGSAPTRSQ